MFKAFRTMIKGALNFNGRTSRRYHNFAIFASRILSYIIALAMLCFALLMDYDSAEGVRFFGILLSLFELVFDIVFIFPMRVRRLHDCDSNASFYIACNVFLYCAFIPLIIFLALDMETVAYVIAALICVSNVIIIVYNLFAFFVASVTDGSKHGSYLGDDYGYFPESSQDTGEKYTPMFAVTKTETTHTDHNDIIANDNTKDNVEHDSINPPNVEVVREFDATESNSYTANNTSQLFDETDILTLSDEIQYGLLRQYYSGKDIDYLVKKIESDYKAAKKRQKWIIILGLGFFCIGSLLAHIANSEIRDDLWRIIAIVLSGIVTFAPISIFFFCDFEGEHKRLQDYYYIITKIQHEQDK